MSVFHAVVIKETGEIRNIGVSPTLEGAMERQNEIWDVFTDIPKNLTNQYYWDYVAEEFKPRPSVPVPSATYDLTQLPAGTTLKVQNESGDELEIVELTGTLTLTDVGLYWISVIPLFPYLPVHTQIEVS